MAKITQVLRRVYADFVKRRSRVNIVPASEPDAEVTPIFIIGLFRSGTTLLRYLIDSHSQIACPPETRFMMHLEPLLNNSRCQGGFKAMDFDSEHVAIRLRAMIGYFMENYARSKGKPRWADKTPEYVDILPFLIRVFPSAQFVLLFRNPLDQIQSNIKSGLGLGDRLGQQYDSELTEFENAAAYWDRQTQKMLKFEAEHQGNCFRIRYEDICESAESALPPLFQFLGESWEPEVLEYYRFEHDYGAEDGKVSTSRQIKRSQTDPTTWNQEDLAACVDLCQNLAERLGYSLPSPMQQFKDESAVNNIGSGFK